MKIHNMSLIVVFLFFTQGSAFAKPENSPQETEQSLEAALQRAKEVSRMLDVKGSMQNGTSLRPMKKDFLVLPSGSVILRGDVFASISANSNSDMRVDAAKGRKVPTIFIRTSDCTLALTASDRYAGYQCMITQFVKISDAEEKNLKSKDIAIGFSFAKNLVDAIIPNGFSELEDPILGARLSDETIEVMTEKGRRTIEANELALAQEISQRTFQVAPATTPYLVQQKDDEGFLRRVSRLKDGGFALEVCDGAACMLQTNLSKSTIAIRAFEANGSELFAVRIGFEPEFAWNALLINEPSDAKETKDDKTTGSNIVVDFESGKNTLRIRRLP